MDKHVVVIGYHNELRQYLTYVLNGDIEMDAIVEVAHPQLELFVPEEWIENGNSLAWLTLDQLMAPGIKAEDPIEQKPFAFPI